MRRRASDRRLRQVLARLADCDWIIEAVVERSTSSSALLATRRPGPPPRHHRQHQHVGPVGRRRWPKAGREDFRAALAGHALLQPAPLSAPARDHPDAGHRPGRRRARRARSPTPARQGRGRGEGHAELHRQPHRHVRRVPRARRARRPARYTIEEIDAMTGRPSGRPKSATFRTLDIAGLDVLRARRAHAARARCRRRGARRRSSCRRCVEELIKRGWIGEKAGQGFYKRVKGPDGESQILVLDPATFEYRPPRTSRCPRSSAARPIEDSRDARPRAVPGRGHASASSCARRSAPTLVYAAQVAPDIAARDRRRGPRDAVGVRVGHGAVRDHRRDRRARRCWRPAGRRDAAAARGTARSTRAATRFRDGALPPAGARPADPAQRAKEQSRVVRQNAGASLVDLGDGVLGRRVPLEDERDRRRRHRDAPRRRRRRRRATSARWWWATRRRTSRPART